MLALIVLLPLAAAMIGIALLRNPKASKYLAIGGSLVALLLLLKVSYGSTDISWITLGTYNIGLSISVTSLNFILLSIVLLIGFLVMVYSSGFMDLPSEQNRYYLEMLAFEASMAAFAVSGGFILLFIAWEFMSLTSYLLIGFWHSKDSANRAARKALMMVFVGDIALLAAIILFWNIFGTLQFAQIISSLQTAQSARLDLAIALLLIAIFTKSAQFPFHEWLIDAMEGPTPVSAYLHSSTMVKAGVFLALLLYPLLALQPFNQVIIVFGIITAVLATLAASREMHIKKVTAYSTIQELSIMLIAIGAGAVLAAIYFFIIQSFYKALLFFSAGSAMKATDTEQLDKMGGIRYNKILFYSTLFGVLSVAGFIPFSGFFANDAIDSALSANLAVYVIMTGISMLTSFYIFRWLSYLSKAPKKDSAEFGYRSLHKSMLYSGVALAAMTLAASLIFLYLFAFLGQNATPAYIEANNALGLSMFDGIIFTAVIVVGAFLAYNTYYKGATKANAKKLDKIIYTGPILNWMYNFVSRLTIELSEGATMFDQFISEGFDQFGHLTISAGRGIRQMSVGNVNSYAMIFIAGVIVLSVAFYYIVII